MTQPPNSTTDAILHEARAPRYTSYPPATQFSDRVGPSHASAWMMAIPGDSQVSLYVHIPFCRRLCWFCACRTQGTKTGAPLDPYLVGLISEMDMVAATLSPGVTVSHLHLGGGTPTMMSPALTDQLFAAIRARFVLTPDAEISVEVDPTEIDDARLDALARGGVNRASLGVQDFEPIVQQSIGRPQSVEQTRFAVDGLRARGIRAINLDLLYGLPHQTAETLDRTLDQVIALGPDRLALYGYAHVPWAAKRQVMIPVEALPDGPARLGLFRHAEARLGDAGYQAIGIDHFAKPGDEMAIAAREGRLHRNFQGYTTDEAETLIGMGASAISRLPGGYAQNASRTSDWRARVERGVFATVRGHGLDQTDEMQGAVIERLLCDFVVEPEAFTNRDGVMKLCDAAARAWPDAFYQDANGHFRIPEDARHLARLIAMEMDRYTEADTARHSRAI